MNRIFQYLLLMVVFLGSSACTISTNKLHTFTQVPNIEQIKPYQTGKGSWYGPGFHGKRTSNGEVFNKNALTAAHKTLPFGTKVEVTNLINHKTVVVTINDRGPFIKGRIIDLSQAAAKSLGIIDTGVANIQLRIIERG